MKRLTSILIAVILGAFATGIGTVPFLVLANQDRQRLDNELQQTRTKAAEFESEKQRIADQANQKVKEANEEVQKAQLAILQAQEDEKLLAASERLTPPSVHELAKWEPAISLSLGVSVYVPKTYSVQQDDSYAFILSRNTTYSSSSRSEIAISFEPYEETKSTRYVGMFASSTSVHLVAGGKLLKGTVGTLLDGTGAALFEVRSSAKTTHLVWMHDRELTYATIKKILSTIQYQ